MNKQKITNQQYRQHQSYDWRTYGKNLKDVVAAMAELGWNARAHCKNRIAFDYIEDTGDILIMNDGEHINLNHAFQFGISHGQSGLCQHGTGMTHATAFISPNNNGDFDVTTKMPDGTYERLCGPFGPEMLHCKVSEWEYPDWATTVIRIHDDNNVFSEYTAQDMGKLFGVAIKNGLQCEFCGQPVEPVLPYTIGDDVNHPELKSFHPKWGSFHLAHTVITVDANHCSQEEQGVTLTLNGCFVTHLGVSPFYKKLADDDGDEDKRRLSPHPSMNAFRDIIDIQTYGLNKDEIFYLPFTNNKAEINWKTEKGKYLRKIIDDLCGARYRAHHDAYMEKVRRILVDHWFKTAYGRLPEYGYAIEASLTDGGKCDAVVYRVIRGPKEYSPARVLSGDQILVTMISFKPRSVTGARFGSGLWYIYEAEAMNRKAMRANPEIAKIMEWTEQFDHPLSVTPHLLLVGTSKYKGYADLEETAIAHNFTVEFKPYIPSEIKTLLANTESDDCLHCD